MKISGITSHTNFKGAYIVKGNIEEISKFQRKVDYNMTHLDRDGYKIYEYTPQFLSYRLSPKQPRYDLLITTEEDMNKLNQYRQKKYDEPLKPLDPRVEKLLENPYTKEFHHQYMYQLRVERSEIEQALGKRIKTISAQNAITAIDRGRFSFISGRIKK